MNHIKAMETYADKWSIVGSRVTCDPPVMDTDEDFLVYINDPVKSLAFIDDFIAGNGWRFDGSAIFDYEVGPDENFKSYSKDGVNLIVTRNEMFYKRFMAATSVAKYLNLLNKYDRIGLFQAVLYGNEWFPFDRKNDLKNKWRPIETAPMDRPVLFWASAYEGLPGFQTVCQYHEDAGWCVDELRNATFWMELPKEPMEYGMIDNSELALFESCLATQETEGERIARITREVSGGGSD